MIELCRGSITLCLRIYKIELKGPPLAIFTPNPEGIYKIELKEAGYDDGHDRSVSGIYKIELKARLPFSSYFLTYLWSSNLQNRIESGDIPFVVDLPKLVNLQNRIESAVESKLSIM